MAVTRTDLADLLDQVAKMDGYTDFASIVKVKSASQKRTHANLSPYTVKYTPEDGADMMEAYTKVETPWHLRAALDGGIYAIDITDIPELWNAIPDEVLDKELEYRNNHNIPIPPVLKTEREPTDDSDDNVDT